MGVPRKCSRFAFASALGLLFVLTTANMSSGGAGAAQPHVDGDARSVSLEATLKPERVQQGDPVSVCMRLFTESIQPLRFWTSGAPADYVVEVVNEGTNIPLVQRPTWIITISRVAHFVISAGHDDVECLPLSRIFDLTAPGSYRVVVTRPRLRSGDAKPDEWTSVAAQPGHLRVDARI
jgi:hypothetical protein